MTKLEQFLKDVRHEIEMLKQHATAEEKEKLNFETFDPGYKSHCIYGQLTGRCTTNRAKELMDLSCVKVFDLQTSEALRRVSKGEIEEDDINGEYSGQTWHEDDYRSYRYLSALEGYIYTLKKNAEIIAYIKGEQEVLEL